MKLPRLEHPDRYAGLYVVDLGGAAGVGYTAEEVAMLAESERYAGMKVYRIHRASPDGTLELTGVPRERLLLETGMFFYFRGLGAARGGFDALRELGQSQPLPCRAQLFLAAGPEGARLPFVVGLAYPAEQDEDVARWLLDHDVSAGEYADGGVGRLEAVRRNTHVLESAQLLAAPSRQARSRDEVLAAVGRPVQRVA
jgi:hypothetical protein